MLPQSIIRLTRQLSPGLIVKKINFNNNTLAHNEVFATLCRGLIQKGSKGRTTRPAARSQAPKVEETWVQVKDDASGEYYWSIK